MYFIISNSDGETRVEIVTKEELLKNITPDEDGYCDYGDVGFMDAIESTDTNYWGDNILIIKGEIVIPKIKKVIESFDID